VLPTDIQTWRLAWAGVDQGFAEALNRMVRAIAFTTITRVTVAHAARADSAVRRRVPGIGCAAARAADITDSAGGRSPTSTAGAPLVTRTGRSTGA
jgi:hypothetical protein